MNAHPCRRDVLGLGAGLAAMGILAACSSSEAISEGTVLADVSDVPEGETIPVLVGETAVILSHTPQGDFTAHSAICTHQGCKVLPDDQDPELLECPCHHSQFHSYTGEVLKGPATEDLPEIPVTVQDGKIIAA